MTNTVPNVSSCHLTCACLFLLSLLMHSTASGQSYPWLGRIDTVTTGPDYDCNPALTQKTWSYWAAYDHVWIVFERRTPTESQIVSKFFDVTRNTWDSAETVVSHAPVEEAQSHPDYSENPRYYSPYGQRLGLAVWQQWKDHRWQIFHSFRVDSLQTWTSPSPLMTDSLDLTYPRAIPLTDSTFLVTCRRGNAILRTRVSPTTVNPPTILATSSSDTIQYDIGVSLGNRMHLVWTSGTPPDVMILRQYYDSFSEVGWSKPETCIVHLSGMPNPHVFVGMGGPTFFFEQGAPQQRDVMMAVCPYLPQSTQVWNVSDDTSATDMNAQGFMQPVITKRCAQGQCDVPWLDVCVFEKYCGSDSSMVFLSYGSSDTVRSPGHNWNACVGSQLWSSFGDLYILVVWESNRSGVSHIYSRVVTLPGMGVGEPETPPVSFRLSQNYPNPFNAKTVVSCQLTVASWVRLAVYDLLGRELAVLVEEKKEPGNYDVTFDGTRLASGVYVYRLSAGEYTASRKMLLLK